MSLFSPKIWGKEVGKAGAACTAGKAILPEKRYREEESRREGAWPRGEGVA